MHGKIDFWRHPAMTEPDQPGGRIAYDSSAYETENKRRRRSMRCSRTLLRSAMKERTKPPLIFCDEAINDLGVAASFFSVRMYCSRRPASARSSKPHACSFTLQNSIRSKNPSHQRHRVSPEIRRAVCNRLRVSRADDIATKWRYQRQEDSPWRRGGCVLRRRRGSSSLSRREPWIEHPSALRGRRNTLTENAREYETRVLACRGPSNSTTQRHTVATMIKGKPGWRVPIISRRKHRRDNGRVQHLVVRIAEARRAPSASAFEESCLRPAVTLDHVV